MRRRMLTSNHVGRDVYISGPWAGTPEFAVIPANEIPANEKGGSRAKLGGSLSRTTHKARFAGVARLGGGARRAREHQWLLVRDLRKRRSERAASAFSERRYILLRGRETKKRGGDHRRRSGGVVEIVRPARRETAQSRTSPTWRLLSRESSSGGLHLSTRHRERAAVRRIRLRPTSRSGRRGKQ